MVKFGKLLFKDPKENWRMGRKGRLKISAHRKKKFKRTVRGCFFNKENVPPAPDTSQPSTLESFENICQAEVHVPGVNEEISELICSSDIPHVLTTPQSSPRESLKQIVVQAQVHETTSSRWKNVVAENDSCVQTGSGVIPTQTDWDIIESDVDFARYTPILATQEESMSTTHEYNKSSDSESDPDMYNFSVGTDNCDINDCATLEGNRIMTDLGAEAALDAEHGDPYVEFLEGLVETCRRQGLPPGLARFFNLGSLPEGKKVKKTPVKKREYKPKHSPKIEALKKTVNTHKSKYQETNKKLQTERTMVRARNILDRIEKDKKILENVLASMEKKNIQMDKKFNERVAATSKEIEKLKNNINHMKESAKTNKNIIDHETKTWKNMEAQAKADLKKRFEELNNSREQMKERIEDLKQHVAEENHKIDREIQNIKDTEAEEESNIVKNHNIKQNKLAKRKEEFEKNLQVIQQTEAEKQSQIEAEIQNMKNIEAQKQETCNNNIELLKNTLAMNKLQFKKNIQEMEQKETEMKAEIQRMNDIKSAKKDNIATLQNLLARTEEEFEKDIEALRQQEEEIEAKLKKKNEIYAQKKEHIEKNIEALHKKFALKEEGVSIGGTYSVLNTRELPRDLHFSRPSTSIEPIDLTDDNIGPIDLTDEETELPSNSANNAASSSR